jgi:hypothetical protein
MSASSRCSHSANTDTARVRENARQENTPSKNTLMVAAHAADPPKETVIRTTDVHPEAKFKGGGYCGALTARRAREITVDFEQAVVTVEKMPCVRRHLPDAWH